MGDFLIKKQTENQVIYVSFCFFIALFIKLVFQEKKRKIHYLENLLNFPKPPNLCSKPRLGF